MTRPLRIAQVAPPFEPVPPRAYGGTERIVHELVVELDRRGHEVTTFASGDSVVPGRHIVTVHAALRPAGYTGDSLPYMQPTVDEVMPTAMSSTSSTATSSGSACCLPVSARCRS